MLHLYPLKLVRHFFKTLVLLFFVFAANTNLNAQCPQNIDFEQGDFTGWQCSIGHTLYQDPVLYWDAVVNPVSYPTRFEMMNNPPGNGRDFYGNFSKNCPNGSGHSIKLGNDQTNFEIEKASYTFTIPAGQNRYSIVYNYAIVLNDPGHTPAFQPKLKITVENLTDGIGLPCPIDDFVAGGNLPGFVLSGQTGPQNSAVWYKNWVATSLNLDDLAGKTIRISFSTVDCHQGGHFGYAYIDVSSQCGSAFTGATFCPDDTAVTVTAPYGYKDYKWYSLTNPNLGNQQNITLNPPPLSGDSIFVELTPYPGYGCLDTLTAYLFDTLTIRSDAGPDRETCDNNQVQLGSPPEPGKIYKWAPATGLSDPNIANPMASPSITTTYTLTVTNSGGGCATPDQVTVNVDILSDSIKQTGPSSYCTAAAQTVRLTVLPHDSIQWYRNGGAIPGATSANYIVTQTGAYYAVLFSSAGCTRTTAVKQINIWESPVAGFNTAPAVQCFTNNQFTFNNSSTLTTGTLQYAWDFGDGNTASTRDVTYNYAKEGTYTVKLLITAPGFCTDSVKRIVQVNPSPTSVFSIDQSQQCFKNNWFVFNTKSTVPSGVLTYTWNFGDGSFDNSNNIAHRYLVPGTYNVKLTATETNGGCSDDSVMQVVVHPSPIADFNANSYNQCFPGHNYLLTNNSSIYAGTMKYLWTFGDNKSDTVAQPSHIYSTYGKYTIKLLINAPAGGCADSLSKDVELFPVPEADFSVRSVCQDIRVPVINRTFNNSTSTVNYYWDFGNGHLDNSHTPVYSYTQPGPYTITLKVSTAQCPVSFNTKSVIADIERQIPGITYPDKDAAFNYAEPLQARNIGSSVTWSPPDNLSNRFSYSPVFKGITPQLYTIQLKTANGCVTIDTQFVKTHKKIEIYVPNGFTPGNDHLNERLRPVLIGFIKVNYFRIYDRWGKLLFSMNSDQPGWDGRLNGNPVNMQTVVWVIEAVDVDGKVHRKQGTTVIIH
jgi:gliding motility-associated-like protein